MSGIMTLALGTKLREFEILAVLGGGAMGVVYRARDTRLNRDVAIKVLPELIANPDRLSSFEHEAQAVAALSHPNIVSVYQMGTYLGVPYLVSELLEGKTLAETLRAGPLGPRKAIDYGVQIARGLAAAHEKGIVHRDLKPDNLFLCKDGRAKILDFGVAIILHPQAPDNDVVTVTLPETTAGTPGYMSPEQVRGLKTDHRSDIFSLGAVLYETVAGKRAFKEPTAADTMSAILHQEPASLSQLLPGVSAGLERVISHCLEKVPEQRFQSASDLAFALEALSDPAIAALPRLPSGGKRRSRSRLIPLGLLTVLLVAGVLAYLGTRPAPLPTVSDYVQLTRDGQPKTLIGTDGTRLYMALGNGNSNSDKTAGIAQMAISGGELQKLQVLPSAGMVAVNLSADGSEFLVIDGQGSPPRGPLSAIPVLGGSPRRLGDTAGETAAWSPDGKMLVYSDLRSLFVARADGTEAHKLLSAGGDIKNVSWSPDGSRLQFDVTESVGSRDHQQLWEASAAGGYLHRMTPGWHDQDDECCGKWTADGEYFVFQSDGQIWALPRAGRLFDSRSEPIALTSSPLSLSSPLPGRSGKKLFVVGQTYRGELTRYDSKSRQFSPFLAGISAEYVVFSKDGQWVSYVSYPEGTLWRSRLDGSNRQQLTYPPMYPVLPRWSPDGREILFFEFAVGPNKPARIYEIASDGGNPHALMPKDSRPQLDPNWSPDGNKIVFAGESNDPSSTIRILDLASRQVATVPGSEGLFSPRWSPDGRTIVAFSGDSTKILLFALATGKWTELSKGNFGWLNLSRDGDYVYATDARQGDAIVRIRISDHKLEQVLDLKNFAIAGRYGGSVALTPDDSLLLLRDTGSQDVYAVDWTQH
jgi:serine/threonine protein kinase/Tol biopolymer transport system component